MNLKNCSMTNTGRIFDHSSPHPSMVDIEDIADGLSKACRWNGGVRGFYSIAQHSVLPIVHKLIPEEFYAAYLLHDAAEAYIKDMIRPVRRGLIEGYEELDEVHTEAIFKRFGIDITLWKHPVVVDADNRMLKTEQLQLRRPESWNPTLWGNSPYEPYTFTINPMDWYSSRFLFLDVFRDVIGFHEWTGGPPPLTGWDKLYAEDEARHAAS